MARESCNLDKDEAEIFKSASSSPSASPPPPPTSPPSPPPASVLPKSCEESPIHRSESPTLKITLSASSSPKFDEEASKSGEESHSPVRFSNRCSTCYKRLVSPDSGAVAAISFAAATATPTPMTALSTTRPLGGRKSPGPTLSSRLPRSSRSEVYVR